MRGHVKTSRVVVAHAGGADQAGTRLPLAPEAATSSSQHLHQEQSIPGPRMSGGPAPADLQIRADDWLSLAKPPLPAPPTIPLQKERALLNSSRSGTKRLQSSGRALPYAGPTAQPAPKTKASPQEDLADEALPPPAASFHAVMQPAGEQYPSVNASPFAHTSSGPEDINQQLLPTREDVLDSRSSQLSSGYRMDDEPSIDQSSEAAATEAPLHGAPRMTLRGSRGLPSDRQILMHLAEDPTEGSAGPMRDDFEQQHTSPPGSAERSQTHQLGAPLDTTLSQADHLGSTGMMSGSYDLELLQQMHVCTVVVLGFPERIDHASVIEAARALCQQHGALQKACAYANKQNRPFALVKMASAEMAVTAVQACFPCHAVELSQSVLQIQTISLLLCSWRATRALHW